MLSPPNDMSEEERVFASGGLSLGVSNTRTETSLRASRRRRRLGDSAYLVLVTTGWFLGNVLGVLGCTIVFFIVLGAGQWDSFFLQVDNLASRYVEADLGRRGLFEHQLAQAFMLVFIAATLLRAPGFVRRVRRELAQEPGE